MQSFPTAQQALPGPGGCPKHQDQVLPAERPRWLCKCHGRIRAGPPGTTTKPQEEKQPIGSAPAAAVTSTAQPASWQESNPRDAGGQLSSRGTGQHGQRRGGRIQSRELFGPKPRRFSPTLQPAVLLLPRSAPQIMESQNGLGWKGHSDHLVPTPLP